MESANHGGGCCGMSHIYGFDVFHDKEQNKQRLNQLIESIKEEIDWEDEGSHLVEIALTDYQLNKPNIREAVREVGFVPVSYFQNCNSENNVTVLHYVFEDMGLDVNSSPFYTNPVDEEESQGNV